MSYIVRNEDDQPESQISANGVVTATQGGANAPVIGGGGGDSAGAITETGGAVGGDSQAQKVAAPAGPTKSGSWVNLQSYLDANKDQARGVGEDVVKSVGAKGEKAATGVSTLGAGFDADVAKGSTVANKGDIELSIDRALNTGSTSNKVSQAVRAAGSPQKSFGDYAGATYSGPEDISAYEGFEDTSKLVTDVSDAAKRLESESGRTTTLQDVYGGKSQRGYSEGQTNLDQLLLAASPENAPAIKAAADKWKPITDEFGTLVSGSKSKVEKAKADTEKTASTAADVLSGKTEAFKSGLDSKYKTASSVAEASRAKILNDLKSDRPSVAMLKELKIDQKTFEDAKKYGIDPTSEAYLVMTPEASLGQFASKSDYEQAKVLAQLAGQDTSDWLPWSNVAQAGTSGKPYTFNSKEFKASVAAAKAAANEKAAGGATGEQAGSVAQAVADAIAKPRDTIFGNDAAIPTAGGTGIDWQSLLDDRSVRPPAVSTDEEAEEEFSGNINNPGAGLFSFN